MIKFFSGKKIGTVILSMMIPLVLMACGNLESSENDDMGDTTLQLSIGHNMNESHTVHLAMMSFVEKVEEQTDGQVQFNVFPNGQLGSETEMLEQLQAGVLDMVKVASPGMANYYDAYHAFGLPFLFNDQDHFYQVMDSPEMGEFFRSTADEEGFVTLTYYTSGQRSFYTANQPVKSPEDLNGLNIRVQDMRSQTDMISAMGGTPVAMAYGDVYTSLQTGMIDGTENNETALTEGQHGEVAKVYSYTEHAMIPDVLVMSAATWDQISEENREIILNAAEESTEEHKEMWEEAVQAAIEVAENEMDVTFITDVDKESFREATEHIIQDYIDEYNNVEEVVDIIQNIN
ncbi:TRAP transporter substrate-binding protein [Alkalibacterium iburiense]|uniref:TRAP transporter substrate-binding protein n=1 Tax=Alkalibacterium iburiense TaxID=290589 RepID=A0ABN0X7J5_9LACT